MQPITTSRLIAWLITVGAMFLAWTGLVDLANHANVKMAAGRLILGLALMISFLFQTRNPDSN
jgi:hypothetical protein